MSRCGARSFGIGGDAFVALETSHGGLTHSLDKDAGLDALALSRRYVEQADFYLGIFAFRYGFVPEGQEKSITELEYDRAVERGIPVFIFIADANTRCRSTASRQAPGRRSSWRSGSA